jgi:hypothetical protein
LLAAFDGEAKAAKGGDLAPPRAVEVGEVFRTEGFPRGEEARA